MIHLKICKKKLLIFFLFYNTLFAYISKNIFKVKTSVHTTIPVLFKITFSHPWPMNVNMSTLTTDISVTIKVGLGHYLSS